MSRYIGVWEQPFYAFEISIGKARRLLHDSKNYDIISLIADFSRKYPYGADLDLDDSSTKDLLFSSVYREQALVLCVTSFEIYLKRKRGELINKKGLSIKELDFQKLDNCEEFGEIIKVQIFEGDERKSLEEPFADRHIIIHNGSIIDTRWTKRLGKPPTLASFQQRINLDYDLVSDTIKKIYTIVARAEKRINQKFNIQGSFQIFKAVRDW